MPPKPMKDRLVIAAVSYTHLTRLRNAGFVTFFFSGICAISSGVVVSLLQEQYGFAYGMTGTPVSYTHL